ncbi:MAG: hypothetical protein Q7J54_04355 [Candidatus Woesearchaeota archaeon]|nr:hypothetical protein [Candidatus Woesearchaeota archaeon]
MLRRKRTVINGVELPEEFSGASIINNIAISCDGQKYAYVSDGRDLITGEMPENGRLEVKGTVINYKKGAGRSGIHIQGSNICTGVVSGSSVVISGGGSSVSIGGKNLEYEIDKEYCGVNKVSLRESTNDVALGLSEKDKVYVKGNTGSEPGYKNNHLFINGLEGVLSLPKSNPGLEIDIKTSTGDIEGKVTHKGIIRTSTGDISLELYAPLTVETNTSTGEVNVKKMISEGNGVYTPPNAKSIGTLLVETSTGDINITYILK